MNKGLLVGINKYPAPNQLRGCDNDVNDMQNFLVSNCAFNPGDIRLLEDASATAQNIKDGLRSLVSGLTSGDCIIFHYSGHGTQIPVTDADDAVQQYRDAICPVDFDFSEPSTFITANDFEVVFGNIPNGVEFVWISDSCFSGGLIRGLKALPKNASYYKIKSPILPAAILPKNMSTATVKVKRKSMKDISSVLNLALISGCTATQESADAYINGKYNGALTYFLLRVLNAPSGLTNPLTMVVNGIVRDLQDNNYEQTPEIFGNPAITAEPFLV